MIEVMIFISGLNFWKQERSTVTYILELWLTFLFPIMGGA